ncbi:spore germination protein [Propionispora hippei]|uniref:Spore germination protein KA n=1 Tax=Propionispora hippei DSM 15287 TaxID=1123003 RepID=A0A1M6LK86_9FIRM|nr:spore germination protein [Propionispora hippei]SHJ71637.1 spore germination protein KA [Propionispora hippei DSM 15287]
MKSIYKKFLKRIRFLQSLQEQRSTPLAPSADVTQGVISSNLEANLTYLKRAIGKSSDMIFREFKIGDPSQTKAFICFIDGLADKEKVDDHVIKALMIDARDTGNTNQALPQDTYTLVKESILSVSELTESQFFNKTLDSILSGSVVLFINGYDTAFILGLRGWSTRNISEPNTENAIRGPREGFTETLRVNTSMLRRKIKNPNLVLETKKLGRQTRTDVCIAYISGIANENILKEVKTRLDRIATDAILESGYIEQYIEDNPFSPFSTIGNSEKPDIVAAKLLEGRIALLCDGTPCVLTVPHLFVETFQSAEDYYSRPYLSTVVLWLRLIAFLITLTAPALYVALETFHQEMIPTVLLITAAAAREGIPFPAFLEALIIGTIFEILRESGVRMPRPIGQAISIVGALVVGEAAVRAGIISAPMVIIAALTAITGFILTPLLDAIVLFRFTLLGLAAIFGLYGVTLGILFILGHLCSLRSFGSPYLAPFAPTIKAELKDSLVRVPLWMMRSRPKSITWKRSRRQAVSARSHTPAPEEGDTE